MPVREAAVAGRFYPGSPSALRDEVEKYLDAAEVTAAPERVAAIIAPHAGYPYSGLTAGHAYARVRGKQPERVVLLGRSHHHYFEDAQIWREGAFETPLGRLPVDAAFAEALAESSSSSTVSHEHEHSLEVQLPFIQAALGEIPIVPVLFGSDPGDWHVQFGQRLASLLGPQDLVVCSTDLSHFLSQEAAVQQDTQSLESVLRQDVDAFIGDVHEAACSMCGATAVAAAMACALKLGATDWKLLHQDTSARASRDYERVVGYGAISMEYPA